MTDIKLTPSSVAAFTEALKGGRGSLDAWLEAHDEREVAAHIEAYANACVARATSELEAEMQALAATADDRFRDGWNRATAEKDAEIDALRTRLEDTVRDSTNKIEALRAEVERFNSWNARVSVCRDHVADIVDGLCVICSLHAAEERADNLQADVKSLQTLRDVVIENQGYWKCRAERLAEALREIANQGPNYGPDGTYKTWRHWAEIARAALEQEDGHEQ